MKEIKKRRKILKANYFDLDRKKTDQQKKLPNPALQKEVKEEILIELEKPFIPPKNNLKDCIRKRRSRRIYKNQALSLEELSYLLWATQGIKSVVQQDWKP